MYILLPPPQKKKTQQTFIFILLEIKAMGKVTLLLHGMTMEIGSKQGPHQTMKLNIQVKQKCNKENSV